jgi:O-antigen ligase
MKRICPVLAVLLFSVFTDWVQAGWPRAVFRASACLLGAAYLVIAARNDSLRAAWGLVPIVLLAAWGLLQLGLDSTVWRQGTWLTTLHWIAYLALYFAALQAVALRSNLRLFAWFGGVFGFFAIILYLLWPWPGERMMGTFLNQNHYAALMELLFPVALWRLLRDGNRSIFVLCAVMMLLSVSVCGSRAGIVLLLAEVVYLGLRAAPKPRLVLAGAIVIAAIAAGAMWNRFEGLSTNAPYDSRKATARASIRMIRERPLLGFGLGTWPNVYPAYAESDTGFRLIHADNDWLEWAAEGGVPFAVIVLGLGAVAVRAAWKEPWSAGCVAVMLHSLVEFPLQKQALWACLLVLLATAQPASARRKQSS